MAQFEVYRHPGGKGLLLDCQSDLLSHLTTRLVCPLLPASDLPPPLARLNPLFEIEGKVFMMVTQYTSAVDLRELGQPIASLSEHGLTITSALDVLLSGV